MSGGRGLARDEHFKDEELTIRRWLLVVVPVFVWFLFRSLVFSFPPPQIRPAMVDGYVVKAATGEPLEKAVVSLRPARGGRGEYSAVTGPDGYFKLTGIEPGEYRLRASDEGYLPAEYGQYDYDQPGTSLTLGSDDHVRNVVFRLVPAAVISGRVTNESGEPLTKVQVQALRHAYSEGQRQMVLAASKSTDNRGEYRLAGLRPGRYYVSATCRMGQSAVVGESRLNVAPCFRYASTYYPGTTDPTRAVPVELQYGGEISGVDISFTPATGVTVRGRVLNTITTRSRRRPTLQLFPRNPSSRAFLTRPETVADAEGKFEIPNVLPGSYMLTASWEDQEERYTGQLAVEVADVDVEGLTVVIDAGLRLSGRVQVEGVTDFNLALLSILLAPLGEAPVSTPTAHVEPEGEFSFQNVPAGTYRVTVTGSGGDVYLKRVTLGGQDVLKPGLDLTYGTAHGTLDVLLGTGAGRVDGSVVDEQGNPAPGARVALVPAPTLRSRTDLYRTTITDQYGNYTLGGIVPGEYKLFAWQDAPAGAYEDPDFLRPFEGDGVPVTVLERGQLTLHLSAIPSRRNRP